MLYNRFVVLLILSFMLAGFFACSSKQVPLSFVPQQSSVKKAFPDSVVTTADEVITISGVGDIMLGTNFPSKDYLPADNGESLLSETTDFFQKSDIVFGNLEGSFLNSGICYKSCSDPKKCYAFRMPESYVGLLKKAGFNLLSVANNHIGDFGLPGRDKTVELLKENQIHFAGLDSHPSTTFEKNGIRYGFAAFAPNTGIPDLRDIDKACEMIRELALTCDIIIVSFHGGAEGAENCHINREDEFFYGENRGNVYEFSHKLIDAGADVILGHGPHITRAIELYNNRLIAYSLGNFCTYARFNLKGANGIAPILQLKLNKTGTFLSGKIIPITQPFKQGPMLDVNGQAIQTIKELTEKDFPETKLIISGTGNISVKK